MRGIQEGNFVSDEKLIPTGEQKVVRPSWGEEILKEPGWEEGA